MADFIQSRVYLIHSVQQPKPTENGKETKPKPNNEDGGTSKPKAPSTNKPNEKSIQEEVERVVGGVSVARRSINIGMQVVSNVATLHFQDAEFKQQFMGDSRGAEIIRQQKNFAVGVVQIATSGASSALTAFALGNPLIIALWAGSQALNLINTMQNVKQQMDQYNQTTNRDMFNSRYSQDRLYRNVYNRRR